jgi:hypothetical protein
MAKGRQHTSAPDPVRDYPTSARLPNVKMNCMATSCSSAPALETLHLWPARRCGASARRQLHMVGTKAIVGPEMAFAGHVFLLVLGIQTGGEGDRIVCRVRLNRGWSSDLRSPARQVSRRSHRVGVDRGSPGPEWGKRRAQRARRGPTDEIA